MGHALQFRNHIRGGFHFLLAMLRGLYFPDEMTLYVDGFIRIVFSLYYIPSIMMVIALTHSALQRVVWILVVPITQDMVRHPYSVSFETLLMGLWHIAVQMAPFAALGLSIATIGHKTMNCFTEAMLDAYTQQDGKDYPLMRARFLYLTEKSSRFHIFVAVLVILFAFVVLAMHEGAIGFSLTDQPLVASLLISGVQAVFVVSTVIRSAPSEVIDDVARSFSESGSSVASWITRREGAASSNPGTPLPVRYQDGNNAFVVYFESDWWGRYIKYMRHIAFSLVLFIGAIFAIVSRGPLMGVTVVIRTVMCLNFPHLLGYTALSVASALIRTRRSFDYVLRHPDVFLPCVVVALPYQLVLLSALCFFRHYPATVILLMATNAMLAARSIDLVREFDMTRHGSVRWENASDGQILAPYLAHVVEDAYEKRHVRTGIVSLEMSVDVKRMRIRYTNGVCTPLTRKQIIPYGAARRFLYSKHFYAYTLPRLLSLQSPGCFAGSRFRTARSVLRVLSITLLLVFGTIVSGMILQAAFPQLRPIPVRVSASQANNALTFDHIVLQMHMLSQQARNLPKLSRSQNEYLSTPTQSLHSFEWGNLNESKDLYPHLCQRDYYGTSVWEVALLALTPYLFNDDEVRTMLNFMNQHLGSDWIIRPRRGTVCIPVDSNHKPTGFSDYYDLFSAQRNTSVIAIRGTDLFSFTDFLIDINLLFETALYQFTTFVIPGAIVVPKELVVRLIRAASLPAEHLEGIDNPVAWASIVRERNHSLQVCHQNNFMRDYFADVQNHLAYTGSQPNPPKHVVLTGHSLGGAVAAIVAAKLDVRAIAFSAPGILLARQKYNIDLLSIYRNVMTVISSSDIVPAIGEHGGEIHNVECLAATAEMCHAMEFLIGSLWRSCHSIRERFPSLKDVV